MESVHRLLGLALALASIAVIGLSAAGWLPRPPARLWVDRAILVALGVAIVAAVAGLVVLVGGTGPADPLHFLYAVVALAALPLARFWPAPRRRRGLLLLGALVLGGVVVRLFQTG